MTNRLTKDTSISYTPGSPGVPYSPGRQARAAYTSYDLREVCGWGAYGGGQYEWVQDETGQWTYRLKATASGSSYTYGYSCSMQLVPTYHPAVSYIPPTPGVPPTLAQIVRDYNLGWSAGARSQAFILNDGYVSFQTSPTAVGVVAGLNYTDPDADFVNIDYAFYITHGVARILESGAQKLYVGPITDATTFKIVRQGGAVSYQIDGSTVYTSLTKSSGAVFLDTSLYSGGDFVDTPAVSGLASTGSGGGLTTDSAGRTYTLSPGALNLLPLVMSAGEGAGADAGASLSFRPLSLTSSPFQGGTQTLERLVMGAWNYAGGGATLTLQPLGIDTAYPTLTPSYALANLSMVQASVSAFGLTGGIGQGDLVMKSPTVLGGRAGYGEARLTMAAATMYASSLEGSTNATMQELVVSGTTASYFGFVDVRLFSSASVEDEYLTLVLKDARAMSYVSAIDTAVYSAVLNALMQTDVEVFAGVPVLTADGEVWVVNDETGASTQYENYSFNSFASYKGRYFGTKADGVYLLEGATDAGDVIRASVSLGRQNFGTTLMKTISDCYIGVASSGDIYLKVIADGASYVYKTNRSTGFLEAQRIATGKGIRANYLTLELFNEAGADFELASIEFVAAVLSRRI